MVTDHINAARDYVKAKAADGVMAVSPIGLARLLVVDEWTATLLLARLQRDDHLVKVGGFVYCESCGEATRLDGGTIETIKASAEALVGKPCGYCEIEFPRIELIKVRLSFFCSPAAKTAGTVRAGATQPAEASSPFSLAQLDQLANGRPITVIQAREGSHVNVGSQVGNNAGGDMAGDQINKAGRDQRISTAPAASKPDSPIPLYKNVKFWAIVIPAAAAIIVAIIKLPGRELPATPNAAGTAASAPNTTPSPPPPKP